MATHSSILAWRIPWTEEPGRLQSMGSQSRSRLSNFPFPIRPCRRSLEKLCFNCAVSISEAPPSVQVELLCSLSGLPNLGSLALHLPSRIQRPTLARVLMMTTLAGGLSSGASQVPVLTHDPRVFSLPSHPCLLKLYLACIYQLQPFPFLSTH